MSQRVDSTLNKGLLILEKLAASSRALRITDLALDLQLNKSNVHRLVKTLTAMNYVTQNADRSYRASFKLWKLGSSVMSQANLAQLCIGEMNKLAQKTGESVHLSVLDGLSALYIEKIDSDQSVRAYTERGGNTPLHCTATGKVLLAYSYESLRKPVSEMLVKHTPKTITSLKALDAAVDAALQMGYSINVGEHREDVGGIAAPVFDTTGRNVAAIGIAGPMSRLTKQKMKECAAAVVAAARSASTTIKLHQG